MTARIMVLATIDPDNADAFEEAYLEVTSKVKGTDGHIADELLRAADDPSQYILLSEWESTDAFLAWEDQPIHKQTTTPMRPYWEGKVDRKLYDVAQTIKSRV